MNLTRKVIFCFWKVCSTITLLLDLRKLFKPILADDGSIPPGIESDDVDSIDDDTSISLPEFESFYVDYPNSENSTIDVVEDIPVDVPNVLPTHPILEQDFIPTSEYAFLEGDNKLPVIIAKELDVEEKSALIKVL
ncbi:hypothetical protein Tco_0288173 [Tanacetum coccineum]